MNFLKHRTPQPLNEMTDEQLKDLAKQKPYSQVGLDALDMLTVRGKQLREDTNQLVKSIAKGLDKYIKQASHDSNIQIAGWDRKQVGGTTLRFTKFDTDNIDDSLVMLGGTYRTVDDLQFDTVLDPADIGELPAISDASMIKATLLSSDSFIGANLNRMNLQGMELHNLAMQTATLAQANLSSAQLTNTNLEGAILTGAILKNANLFGANLKGAVLAGADLMNASLSPQTILPDGSRFRDHADLARFTDVNHPKFEETMAKVKQARVRLGLKTVTR